MRFKDILVHVDTTPASRVRVHLALTLGRRFGAAITGLHVIPTPNVPPYFKPSAIDRITKIYEKNAQIAAERAEVLFRDETAHAGPAILWECLAGDLDVMIAERARFADLLLLGKFDTENPPMISAFLLPAKVVLGAAAPIIVVPNIGLFDDVGQHVLIAWDGSREAARAVRDALPLLQVAEQVSFIAIDPLRQGHMRDGVHPSALAIHLARHGIRAEQIEGSAADGGVASGLLGYAQSLHADLLVMGAYGNPPGWEFIVGGTTADILEQTPIPVLMSR